MIKIRQTLILPTQLGFLSFEAQVTGASLVDDDISLQGIAFAPKLPAGMTTSTCTAVLLQVRQGKELQSLRLHAELATEAVASACTGEYLDAQEWSDGESLVVIGTEDSQALDIRYPCMGFADILSVDFGPQSMTLKIDRLPSSPAASFHFIVAENPDPEPVEPSAWFAVDQSHKELLRLT
ncbi:hypothetical protein [Roseicitreum antarcticum]|uniref:Uncharacterized protein n=1 Tax=Roseicitreum antarcticum TaxID=564137 RepID=A0A1H2WYM7_9RHOB|nr:hypothetical protein [Roseicitreum antarcticum]SDW85773.1 hypothetical protein SAMN04488238_1042 [Roseicitreum antarcticum]